MSDHLAVLNNELHRLHELLKYLIMCPDREQSEFILLKESVLMDIITFQDKILNYDLNPKLKFAPNVTPLK